VESAFRYSLDAGDAALQLYAIREATAHFQEARALCERLSPAVEALERLYLQLGRAHELDGDYESALAVYKQLEALAQELGDRSLELEALMARATALVAPTGKGESEATRTLLERGLALARDLQDAAAEAKVLWNLMLHVLFTDAAQAVAHGEASLDIAREQGLKRQMAHTLHDLQRAYMFTGRSEEGINTLLEAQELWRALDDRAMLADNLANFAFYCYMGGNYDQGLAAATEAQGHSEAIANLWGQSYSRLAPSFIYFDRGLYGQAIKTMRRCIELGEAAGFVVPGGDVASALGLTYGLLEAFDQGFVWVERALTTTEEALPDFVIAPLAARSHLYLL
jgi:tetratricopeptide (TPR) repeat protein